MRKILYRFYDNKNKKWKYCVFDGTGAFKLPDDVDINSINECASRNSSSAFEDMKGERIFENDIIQCAYNENFIVRFEDGMWVGKAIDSIIGVNIGGYDILRKTVNGKDNCKTESLLRLTQSSFCKIATNLYEIYLNKEGFA